jgi:uncharacterized SAM-binding protein YcdF (DUF218 family)
MEGIIVLLGAPNNEFGQLSTIAVERCQQAILEYHRYPGYKILPTGGYGAHFNETDHPHAYYSTRYLIAYDIPAEDILAPVISTNTVEDVRLARPEIERSGARRVVVVTSDFHIPRAQFLFERERMDLEITFSGCETHLSPQELAALYAHEEQSLTRLRSNQK